MMSHATLTSQQRSLPVHVAKLQSVLAVLRKILGRGKPNTPLPDSPHDGVAYQLNVGKEATTEDGEPYSIEGLSPLETIVPDELMPDELIVHDPFNLTRCRPHPPARPTVRYGRATPLVVGSARLVNSTRAPAEGVSNPRVAHLYLSETRLGEGGHSSVFRAPLELRLDPGTGELTRGTVAVKMAARDCVSHGMLHQEAMMYTAFPRTLMEVTSLKEPPSAAVDEVSATTPPVGHRQGHDGQHHRGRQMLSAVVPKFYGYYLPLDDDGNLVWSTHSECSKECDVDWPSGLLLVEECGQPIKRHELTTRQRYKCFWLYKRLHKAGFTQGSPHTRNILVQAGPLWKARERRTMERPSFRLIDFGRGEAALDSRKEAGRENIDAIITLGLY